LSNGRGRKPLILKLPDEYQSANIVRAELTWRADHYKLRITLDTGEVNPPFNSCVKTAGVDLGEVNIAVVVTDAGQGVVIAASLTSRAYSESAVRSARCCSVRQAAIL